MDEALWRWNGCVEGFRAWSGVGALIERAGLSDDLEDRVNALSLGNCDSDLLIEIEILERE